MFILDENESLVNKKAKLKRELNNFQNRNYKHYIFTGLANISNKNGEDSLANRYFLLSQKSSNIDIYTNSWGPPDSGNRLGGAGPLSLASIEHGVNQGRDGLGAIYTWANGNGLDDKDQSNKDGFANSRYTIAVGSVDWQGEQTWFAETGSNMLVSAPSFNYFGDPAIFTTDVSGSDGDTSTDYTPDMGGTSASTPMVAGVVALMIEANSNLTWRDVQHILVKTSRQVDTDHPGWFQTEAGNWYNHAYGYGLVDATAAVNMAKVWESVGTELKVNTGEISVDEYIPDNNDNGISSTVIVNESITIESVEVMVDVWHDWRGDLNLFLTSPNGLTSELVRSHNDGGDHYENWIFTTVVHWDEDSFGDWTLKVNDTDSSYTGEFRSWNLTFYGAAGADDDEDVARESLSYFEKVEKEIVRQKILDGDNRIDGRDTKTVRPIDIKLGILSRAHGSALFTRGETQALVVTTLGSKRDEMIIDSADKRKPTIYKTGLKSID